MFCGNCGVENANGASFCKACGKPLGNNGRVQVGVVPPANGSANEGAFAQTTGAGSNSTGNNQIADKIKALPKQAFVAFGVAVVAIIAIVCVAVNSGRTINLNKYLTITTEGYDGYGKANATIDWDAIERKYGSKISFTNNAKSEYGELLYLTTPIEAIREGVSVSTEPSRNLSNGDEIAYTWNVDNDLSNYVKCKVKFKNGTQKASGLTEVARFDAFADLDVEFSGIAPNGTANINYTGSELSNSDFNYENTYGLSNGDKVKVYISDSRIEYYAENLGKIPAELEKEYTVEGLDSYVTKLSEISDASLSDMKQQAEDVFNAYVSRSWDDDVQLQSFTYMGDYLLTAKNSDTWGSKNILYLVYKAQAFNSYSNKGKSYSQVNDVYWYIAFYNLLVNSDGTVTVDVTNYDTPSDSFTVDSGVDSGWYYTKAWRYYGYQTLNDLYKQAVGRNMDTYNHEDNVSEDVSLESADVSETAAVVTGDYKLPDSDTKLITVADLEGFTAEDCKIARNEIYARHGRKFNDAELQAYFNALDWYEGTIEPDDFKETDLSDIEIANKDTIVKYEEEQGYR